MASYTQPSNTFLDSLESFSTSSRQEMLRLQPLGPWTRRTPQIGLGMSIAMTPSPTTANESHQWMEDAVQARARLTQGSS
jgi:hypothetical protein